MEGLKGWLIVYVIGSVPLTLFYAIGLSGRFFNYHIGAVIGIFLALALPLVLMIMNLPSAPAWNIASLWVGAGSISLVVLGGALSADEARLEEVGMVVGLIVFVSIAWAVVWTSYLLTSDRVATTFN